MPNAYRIDTTPVTNCQIERNTTPKGLDGNLDW